MLTSLNDGWIFHCNASDAHIKDLCQGEAISLPHNAVELPYDYLDEKSYQRPFDYQRVLEWRPEFDGAEVSLVFDGAMANSAVYLNGREVGGHTDGYTPFEVRLTEFLQHGGNLVTLRLDGTENRAIPPFAGRIDYLTYAGIYRDVWLKVTPPVAIGLIKVETPDPLADLKTVRLTWTLRNPASRAIGDGAVTIVLADAAGTVLRSVRTEATVPTGTLSIEGLAGLSVWDIDSPTLYTLTLRLETEHGEDTRSIPFGFRHAEFTPDGFFLNGRRLVLRGLNRHQSYPYVGYAMGRRAQERDADILKYELDCNIVRTSHYPQSPWFIDRCDQIGLLVFEEIPGWQYFGDEAWQNKAIENVRFMIERDWNHPSIVLWGVRINESRDCREFYTATNKLARELDPTRQTGGVRCILNSEFLEDVFTMNDFLLGEAVEDDIPVIQRRPPLAIRDQRDVTGLDHNVPYLVTEFGGHMFPTKRWDQEQRQVDHVLRHLEVLENIYADPHKSGGIAWCMADYNTHKDFGSGDRICHHGVLDMFREPKFAAFAYSSQRDPAKGIVLKPVTWWARGERNACRMLPLVVLTNCEAVELRYGNTPPVLAGPDRDRFPNLPHAPVIFDNRQVPPEQWGQWGQNWADLTVIGLIGGKVVKTITLPAAPLPTRLDVEIDTDSLLDEPKDATRVIVRVLDQMGNVLPFFGAFVDIEIAGPGVVVGPRKPLLRGGTAGFWVEATGGTGEIVLTVTVDRLASVTKVIQVSARS